MEKGQWIPRMLLILFSVSLCFSWVSPASHSLRYYYTTMSGSADFPEFIHVGVLDDVQITYYDSITRRDIPRQPWMSRALEGTDWNRETQRLIKRQELSLANERIATKRTNSSKTGLNFLQYTSGCELSEDGVVSGVRQYAFNGRDLISFDLESAMWVTGSPAALITKRKWNINQDNNHDKQRYTREICIDWMRKYLQYGAQTMGRKVAPEVMIYDKKTADGQKLILHCLATGFYPQSINMTWIREGEPIANLPSSGILPNHDGTYQIRISLPTEPGDRRQHICRVEHSSLSQAMDTTREYGAGLKPWMIAVIVLVALVLVGGIACFLYRRRGDIKHLWCLNGGPVKVYSPTPSIDSSQSSQTQPTQYNSAQSVEQPLV